MLMGYGKYDWRKECARLSVGLRHTEFFAQKVVSTAPQNIFLVSNTMALLLLFSFIFIQPQISHAVTSIYCDKGANCDGSTYECGESGVCSIWCNEGGSCKDVTFTNAKILAIYCNQGANCDGSTFECDEVCALYCNEGGSCKNVKIVTSNFDNVECTGDTCDQVQVCYLCFLNYHILLFV